MADPTENVADEAVDAPKKKSKLLPVVVMLVTGAGGYFVGTGLLAPRLLADSSTDGEVAEEADGGSGHGAPAPKEDGGGGHGASPPEGESHFLEVGNLLVNPKDSRGMRFLMATVALEFENDATRASLRQREAQVRDVVISVLERWTLEELAAPGARDSLRIAIKAAVNDEFHLPFLNVFIPQFVIN